MTIELPPDIEAGLVGEAALRGVTVDVVLRDALAAYARPLNDASGGVRRVLLRNRSAEMAWTARSSQEFVGKWVALEGGRVLAAGPNAKAVYDEAKSKGIEVPFIAYVSQHPNEPFAGGWLD